MHEKNSPATIKINQTEQKIILLIDDDEDEHEIFQSALKHVYNSANFLLASIINDQKWNYFSFSVNSSRFICSRFI